MAFLRDDLAQLAAYQSPHPASSHPASSHPASFDPTSSHLAEHEHPESFDHKICLQPALDPLDTNESPIDLPQAVKAALASQYEKAIAANRYPDGNPLALKQAIRQYAIHSGAIAAETISIHNITLGNGSDELIRSVIMATCLGGHGSILVAPPTFSMYSILANTLGVPVHSVGRNDQFEVDIAAAQTAIDTADGPPIRVIFMVHPNSPTGNALTQREIDWLRQLPSDILVMVDEAYFEFSGQTTLADALSRPNWLITRTFSKAFRLAAHRVGYGIAHPSIITALEKLRLPYNLPSFSQAAAQTALAHSEQLLTQIPIILAERHQLIQALSHHPYLQVWPSDSNFIYVRLSEHGLATLGVSEQAQGLSILFEQLKANGTLIRNTGGGLRISIGTAAENQRTLANLQTGLPG
ncbi:MAG: histidinol-phosphate transaminase [Phormidesmis sp. RL_2_1]|nr:histidinol-phosphate transaminase [Phormidesmis sp. RL_2_1]